MAATQTYKNHAKLDPLHHFLIMPLLILNLAFAFVLYHRHHTEHLRIALWWIVLSCVFILIAAKTRVYSLQVQDRVIRLEERTRLKALLPPADHATISALTMRQLIALRFASDEELPGLARRALSEHLDAKQIKQAITKWRPDDHRI